MLQTLVMDSVSGLLPTPAKERSVGFSLGACLQGGAGHAFGTGTGEPMAEERAVGVGKPAVS